MTQSELEKLIRLITSEVLKVIGSHSQKEGSHPSCRPGNGCQCNGDSHPAGESCHLSTGSSSIFTGKVLSAARLEQLERTGERHVLIGSQTIITPLAAELAREKQISLICAETEPASGKTAGLSRGLVVLYRSCSESQRNAVVKAAQEHGYSPRSEASPGGTAGMFLKSAVRFAGQISCGETERLIVLDENVYPLSVQLKKLPGIEAQVCWDAETATASQTSNVLLLHSRQLGRSMLGKITTSWLGAKE